MSKNPKSLILVFIQFATLGIIFATGSVLARNPLLLGLESLGICLEIWAILFMCRQSKLQVTADVAPGSHLVISGPYRYIRHPMYVGLMLISVSLLIDQFSYLRALICIILWIDLLVKIDYEEKLLKDYFKEEYTYYQSKTHRLLPFIY